MFNLAKKYKTLGAMLIVLMGLALLLPVGCKKDEDVTTGSATPLFLTLWGESFEAVKAGEDEAALVSDANGVLIYKKTFKKNPIFVTYEFNDNKLVSTFFIMDVKSVSDNAVNNLIDDFEILITRHLGNSRYIISDDLLYLNEDTLVIMQVINEGNRLKTKIAFYAARALQNAPHIKTFEELWRENALPKGQVNVE